MKINEILDKNKPWAILLGVDRTLLTKCNDIISTGKFLTTAGVNRAQKLLPALEQFSAKLSRIASRTYPDQSDEDLNDILTQIRNYETQLNAIIKQIRSTYNI